MNLGISLYPDAISPFRNRISYCKKVISRQFNGNQEHVAKKAYPVSFLKPFQSITYIPYSQLQLLLSETLQPMQTDSIDLPPEIFK